MGTIAENDLLLHRASTKHIRTYLNFMKMRAKQGLLTPADEDTIKQAQKHYSLRLLHKTLTSKNIKNEETVKEDYKENLIPALRQWNSGKVVKGHVGQTHYEIAMGTKTPHKKNWETGVWHTKEKKWHSSLADSTELMSPFQLKMALRRDPGLEMANKWAMSEEAPTNVAGSGNFAGIGIDSPTIKNPPQAEPGIKRKPKPLKRLRNIVNK